MLRIPIMHLMHAHIVHVHCCDVVFWAFFNNFFFWSFHCDLMSKCIRWIHEFVCTRRGREREMKCDAMSVMIMHIITVRYVILLFKLWPNDIRQVLQLCWNNFYNMKVLIFNECFCSDQILYVSTCRCFCIYLLLSIWILFK